MKLWAAWTQDQLGGKWAPRIWMNAPADHIRFSLYMLVKEKSKRHWLLRRCPVLSIKQRRGRSGKLKNWQFQLVRNEVALAIDFDWRRKAQIRCIAHFSMERCIDKDTRISSLAWVAGLLMNVLGWQAMHLQKRVAEPRKVLDVCYLGYPISLHCFIM